jgi:hypothetical protein
MTHRIANFDKPDVDEALLVGRHLAKVEVAGSTPVIHSIPDWSSGTDAAFWPRRRRFNSFIGNHRVVAQVAARLIWDQEDGSSSLPYPTTLL